MRRKGKDTASSTRNVSARVSMVCSGVYTKEPCGFMSALATSVQVKDPNPAPNTARPDIKPLLMGYHCVRQLVVEM